MTLTLERPRGSSHAAERSLFCSECGMRLESPAQTKPTRCAWCEREVGGG
ncbi:MAG: hypothetical protein WEB06_08845 [Actinomycetota bacterium]